VSVVFHIEKGKRGREREAVRETYNDRSDDKGMSPSLDLSLG
jgi:hypothetical protein